MFNFEKNVEKKRMFNFKKKCWKKIRREKFELNLKKKRKLYIYIRKKLEKKEEYFLLYIRSVASFHSYF